MHGHKMAGSAVTLSNPTDLTTMFTAPTIGADGNATLHFTVTAQDPYGGSGSDSVLVHVISASAYKLATLDCGPIIRSHEGGSATLVEAVDNPSSSPLTYQWTQVSGAPIQISSTTDASPTVTLPNRFWW